LAASGDPIDDKKAEAARIQDQLDAQGEKVSVAAQRFNRAQLHLEEVRSSLAKAETDVKRSGERMQEIKGRLAQAAVVAYIHGGTNSILSRLARSSDQSEFFARRQYLQVAANDQRAILGELRSAKEDFTSLRSRLVNEEKDAKVAADGAAASRADAVAAENAQRAILSKAQGDLADLVAAEANRRLQAEAAKAPPALLAAASAPAPAGALAITAPADDAPVAAAPAPLAASTPGPQVASKAAPARAAPAPASGAGTAVAVAEDQIGKPYAYGGSGPDSFDCSGLTSYAWRAGGVSLSHDAYRQWFETTRIPIDSVQPGDLLFFGDDGVESIHHVAIYVGGGQMVEASQTGVPVRYRGWRAGDLVGAGRPG
jgi:cell wall-associated NlpC family hydrolase